MIKLPKSLIGVCALNGHQSIETNNRGRVLVDELQEGDQLYSLAIPWMRQGVFETRKCSSDLTKITKITKIEVTSNLVVDSIEYKGIEGLPLVLDDKCNSITRQYEPKTYVVNGLNMIVGIMDTESGATHLTRLPIDGLETLSLHTMWEQPYFTGAPLTFRDGSKHGITSINPGYVHRYKKPYFQKRSIQRTYNVYAIECSPYNYFFLHGLLIFNDANGGVPRDESEDGTTFDDEYGIND